MSDPIYIRIGEIEENKTAYEKGESARRIFDLMVDRSNGDRETMHLILLSAKNDIIGIELHALGTLNRADIHLREIVKSVILKNAAALVLVHNHPSGDPEPSFDDRASTKLVADAMHLIGCTFLDHLIIGARRFGRNDYFSFSDHGAAELKGSGGAQ